MPELAEVEFYRRRWAQAATGDRVSRILAHDAKRPLRGLDGRAMRAAIEGQTLKASSAAAKQMLFRFGREAWLGIHLGMSGELFTAPSNYLPGRHDHLVLFTEQQALVYRDQRMFGKIAFHRGPSAPAWWTNIAPPILSGRFTIAAVTEFLERRRGSPIKAVLLMQERFPGLGNWMADEVLWRACIHPARPAGELRPAEVRALWRECRQVCRQALRAIAGLGRKLPADLNVGIPKSWLFLHRWEPGGKCPKSGQPLTRATIGGRTACWSPARQKLR